LQILVALDNPLALAMEKGETAEGLMHAASMDLDTLQRLALAESTLAGWVKIESGNRLMDADWVKAASTLGGMGRRLYHCTTVTCYTVCHTVCTMCYVARLETLYSALEGHLKAFFAVLTLWTNHT
jgi:hypothetical protein